MKLSHLSLAILSAITLAACGGSGSSDQVDDGSGMSDKQKQEELKRQEELKKQQEALKKQQEELKKQKEELEKQKKEQEKKKEEANLKKDEEIVDPTKDRVVDAIDLSKTSTTASQQYLRGKKSKHDRSANPDMPASTTVLSGISLDEQNPQLTNIVIGRAEGKNKKGEEVRIAQFAGSENSKMPSVGGDTKALQTLNKPNALVQSGYYDFNGKPVSKRYPLPTANYNKATKAINFLWNGYIVNQDGVYINPVFDKEALNYGEAYNDFMYEYRTAKKGYDKALADYNQKQDAVTAAALIKAAKILVKVDASSKDFDKKDNTKIINKLYYATYDATNGVYPEKLFKKLNISSEDMTLKVVNPESVSATAPKPLKDNDYLSIKIKVPKVSKLAAYGYGSYIYALANDNVGGKAYQSNTGWGDEVNAKGEVKGAVADSKITGSGAPTHGLVGIWEHQVGGKKRLLVRGADDNNIRTTRVFGHYYLDPGSADKTDLLPELNNSWFEPETIITGIDKDDKPNKYGLVARPATLDHVQYGRVTAEMDEIDLLKEQKSTGWVFREQNLVERDPSKEGSADDFYFYRGTGATSVEDMGKLPTDTKIAYKGHALMYGIDNSFHGSGQKLPNSFGRTQSYGLGNFVDATLDMGKKELTGTIFNAWHSDDKEDFVKDVLVDFSGDVTGNTAYGIATRHYVQDDKPAVFKASFYGANASELGGAVNSVNDKTVYGDIGWGGVFGAQRTSVGGNSWLVSSEQK